MSVKLQLLLRPERRTAEDLAAVRRLIAALGFIETASGKVTLSATMSEENFRTLFDIPPGDRRLRSGSQDEAGGLSDVELPIPGQLRDYVASITIAPRHLYFRQ
jgi:hypothetical protein